MRALLIAMLMAASATATAQYEKINVNTPVSVAIGDVDDDGCVDLLLGFAATSAAPGTWIKRNPACEPAPRMYGPFGKQAGTVFFLWEDTGASVYVLTVDNQDTVVNIGTNPEFCANGTCQVVQGFLPAQAGPHSWTVRGWTAGIGPSAPRESLKFTTP